MFQPSAYPFVFACFIALWLINSLRKLIKPFHDQSETPGQFKTQIDAGSLRQQAEHDVSPLLGAAEIRQRLRDSEDGWRRMAWFPLLLGGAFCWLSYFIWQETGGQHGWIIIVSILSGLGSLMLVSTLFRLARSGSKRL